MPPFLTLSRATAWTKQAEDKLNTIPKSDAQVAVANHERTKYLSNVLQATALGGAAGLGAGGVWQFLRWLDSRQGLRKLVNKQFKRTHDVVPDELFHKQSSNLFDQAAEGILNLFSTDDSSRSYLPMPQLQPIWEAAQKNPVALGGGIGGAAMGLTGGWYLSKYLGEQLRKKERAEEMEDARLNYEKALLETQADPSKQASTQPTSLQEAEALLDQVQGEMEKRGLFEFITNPWTAYAAAAIPIAGTVGYLRNYDSNRKIIETALKRRAAQRALMSPEPLEFVTLPRRKPRKKSEDEDDTPKSAREPTYRSDDTPS